MRQRHAKGAAFMARETLRWCGIDVGSDFHTLRTAQVEKILQCAKEARYQKPPNANGSTARYFHDRLQRQVRSEPKP